MKKLIAFLMILAVVLTGVFAEPGDQNDQVKVYLKGTIGEYFRHGVKEGNDLVYTKTFDEENGHYVLAAGGTSFTYGYKSNQEIPGVLYMNYTDFSDGDGHTIQIGTLEIGGSTMTVANYVQQKGFLVFNGFIDSQMQIEEKSILVKAAQVKTGDDPKGIAISNIVGEATKGTYTATLTFEVRPD